MEIGLQTRGSDGDIRSIPALAGGLRARGHEVSLERVIRVTAAMKCCLQYSPDYYIVNIYESISVQRKRLSILFPLK